MTMECIDGSLFAEFLTAAFQSAVIFLSFSLVTRMIL